MDFRISEEQRAFVDVVRRVCQKDFKARAIRYLDGTWPAENMKSLAEIGVLGMAVPQECTSRSRRRAGCSTAPR